MEKIKRHIFLIIGVAIPFLAYLLLASSIYVANLNFKPQYNFLYVVDLGDARKIFFNYDNNIDRNIDPARLNALGVKFLLYDVKNSTKREVSFEEVKNLKINSNSMAPDGFELEPYIINEQVTTELSYFFSTNPSRIDGLDVGYLRRGRLLKKIDMSGCYGRNGNDGEFLGWVIE